MIENFEETHGPAFGFKVIGKLSADDIVGLSGQIDKAIAVHCVPIGLLADLSQMEGASWASRWEEMRFLQRHSERIARMAIIRNDDWQEISEMILVATVALQAQTLYFHSSEIHHAWHWVKMGKIDNRIPVRLMYPGKGLFHDYTPEYMGI
jgi:hypothetical protein